MDEHRKRRLVDDNDTSASTSAPHPPPKKQWTAAHAASGKPSLPDSSSSSSSSPGTSTAANSDPVGPDSEDRLLQFQKEAILRQLYEYRRKEGRACLRIEELETRQDDYDSTLSLINVHWGQLLNDLRMLLKRAGASDRIKDVKLSAEEDGDASAFLRKLLAPNPPSDQSKNEVQKSLRETSEYTKEVVACLLRRFTELESQRTDLFRQIGSTDSNKISELLKQENNTLLSQTRKQENIVDELEARCHSLTTETTTIKDDLQRSRNKHSDCLKQLEMMKEDLLKAEKRLDRARHSTTRPQESSDRGQAAGGDNKNSFDSFSGDAREQLAQLKQVADSRLAELEEMKSERIKLKQEIDALKMQSTSITDELVLETGVYKTMQSQCAYFKQEYENTRGLHDRCKRELEEMHANRRMFMEQMQSEETTRRQPLQITIQKLESDLARVRANRDQISDLLKLRTSRDDADIIQNQEIRALANARKDRISSLIADVQRLKMGIAAEEGDREALDHYSIHAELKYADGLKQKLEIAEKKVGELTASVNAYRRDGGSEKHALEKAQLELHGLQKEVTRLADRVKYYEALLGNDVEISNTEMVKTLTSKIEERDETIRKLEVMIDGLQKGEKTFQQEFDSICQAYSQLEEQNSRKVLDLAQKEDTIVKTLAEKLRAEQKWREMGKQKEAQGQLAQSVRRQSEKLLEQVRRLEEREKNLNLQLTNTERELSSTQSALQIHKDKLGEAQQHNSEVKEKTARSETRFAEMQTVLKERTSQAESEAHGRRRALEEVEKLRRRLDLLLKEGGDVQMEQQLRDMKALMKCNACELRFKSHCLSRCMHVFCKECIDTRLDTRQRKCPNCALPFTANEVKQIYL